MVDEEKNIDFLDEEKNDNYSDDDLYNISSWGADLSFRELIERYKDGDLVKPEMQRNYVWDKAEASRFIDSILLGLPVPSIFLAKSGEETMLIVDGYQRIMTVFDYVEEGIFRTDGKVFRLTNSGLINERWRNKAFAELSDTEQRRIKNTTIHSIIFSQLHPKNDDTSMYQVFERINTSGRTLIPQEIRNCVYQGKFNTLLLELNQDTMWRKLYGLDTPDSRMRDIEFVLRFLAVSDRHWDIQAAGTISLKKFLNQYMGNQITNTDEFLSKRREDFLQTIKFIHNNFDENVFQNILSKDPTKSAGKFNPTIFDSITVATFIAISLGTVNIENLNEKKAALLLDEDFQDLIKVRTTNESRIAKRIATALRYLYGLNYE